MTNTKVKEYAVVDFMDMTYNSWTWLRMTHDEQQRFFGELTSGCSCDVIKGSYDNRRKIIHALYTMYLKGLGYGYLWREKESNLAEIIEQFMFERGEYDECVANSKIRWLNYDYIRWHTDDRKTTTWNILNDILNGNVSDLINYFECQLAYSLCEDDELIPLAKDLIEKLKEV